MAVYTSPVTVTTGDLITAAVWNSHVVENAKVFDAIGFDYVIDGSGAAITTGVKFPIRFPVAMTIDNVTLTGDVAGSADIDFCYKASWDSDVVTTSDSLLTAATSDGGTTDKMLQIVTNTISSDTYPAANWTSATVAQGGAFALRVHANATITRITAHFRASKT